MPMRMTALMKPIIQRKLPETKVPITAPVVSRAGMFATTVLVAAMWAVEYRFFHVLHLLRKKMGVCE
jgi:hypothetical protein